MQIKVVHGDISTRDVGAIVVNLFEDVKRLDGATGAVDDALDGAISSLIGEGEIKGKQGEITLIHTFGKISSPRVVVLGLGAPKKFDSNVARNTSGTVARYIQKLGVKKMATITHGTNIGGLETSESVIAVVEGTLLGKYRFNDYKSTKSNDKLEVLEITEIDKSKIQEIKEASIEAKLLVEATTLCRDMVNTPANDMTPTTLSERALDIAATSDLDSNIMDREHMQELGMGALLGVAQGSKEDPKLIELHYKGDPENEANNLAIVGKGITFDSGGISLKPAANMGAMKGDMAGGAAVISAMKAIAALKPKINVSGFVAAAENMPGGSAQRPGDVVKTMTGKTIEIDNTDAEGRLVLADTVAYAHSKGFSRIVDVATLTGAIITTLGYTCTGVFGNSQLLTDAIIECGRQTGEKMWHLPTFEEYKDLYKSDIADIKNTGGRPAGSITGALIIGEFVGDAEWAHLDIAGTSMAKSTTCHAPKGATGVPVRTLVKLTQVLAE